jgi:hypothetical protein
MVDSLFALLFDDPIDWYERLGVPVRQGNRILRFSPINTYATRDGWAVLGAATGVLALAAGTLAAWIIAFSILDVPFTFDAQAVIVTVAGGGAATLLFGLLGGLGALSVRPARRLRST